MKVLLIDGDIFAYQAAFANSKTTDWGDTVSEEIDIDAALTDASNYILEIEDKFQPQRTIVALSDNSANFRKKIAPYYKANRPPKKPAALYPVRRMMAEKFEVKKKDTLEADDVLGILMTHPKLVEGKKIIVSVDKDLLQIPGRHYNPQKDTKQVVKEVDADIFFFTQVLTGDQTDHYPGLPGVGPVKAAKIIQDGIDLNAHLCGHVQCAVWDGIVKAYESKGLTEADARVQARLARILRHTDYDFKRKEPILWTP